MNPIDEYYHMIYEDIRLAKAVFNVTDDAITVKLSYALATVFALANRFLVINIDDGGLRIFGCKAETYNEPDVLCYRVMVEAAHKIINKE